MSQLLLPRNKNIGPSDLDNAADFCLATLAQIIWSWQYCRLLVGNIANGIASNFFLFLTELGNFKQKIFWRQCHWQSCQVKVCSIVKGR